MKHCKPLHLSSVLDDNKSSTQVKQAAFDSMLMFQILRDSLVGSTWQEEEEEEEEERIGFWLFFFFFFLVC